MANNNEHAKFHTTGPLWGESPHKGPVNEEIVSMSWRLMIAEVELRNKTGQYRVFWRFVDKQRWSRVELVYFGHNTGKKDL